MPRTDKPRGYTSLRLEDMELLRQVKRDIEKRIGIRLSFGQVVSYLCNQWKAKA